MIVVARSREERAAMLSFLHRHNVKLPASEDLHMIGRVENDRLIGVVGYNGFCGNICSMHCAGEGNWVSREFLRAAFNYPFRQLKLAAVTAPVPADNPRALRFDRHLGFREVYRVKDGWEPGVDLAFLEMKREDCVYVESDLRMVA